MIDDVKREIKLPEIIPLFPLTGVVMFPDTYLPLNIFEPRYLKMIDKAIKDLLAKDYKKYNKQIIDLEKKISDEKEKPYFTNEDSDVSQTITYFDDTR